MQYDRKRLAAARRVVIKIGTNTLTNDAGRIDTDWLADFVSQVKIIRDRDLKDGRKRYVILVSSGAIGAGCVKMKLNGRPPSLPKRQAVAAVGQVSLMRAWEEALRRVGLIAGQLLLTKDGINDRKQYLNARNTLDALLDFGVVPVINENDSISVDEIKIGDNDTLSAHVTLLTDADMLILLTDQEGFMDRDPNGTDDAHPAKRIGVVPEIDDAIRSLAGEREGSQYATGGMSTKLIAAKMVTESGASMLIVPGRLERLLPRIFNGEDIGTWFPPQATRLKGRKRWIAFSRDTAGTLVLDDGACHALVKNGKSLLAVGIRSVSGRFGSGDSVNMTDMSGKLVARGLVNYTAEELSLIKGLRKDEISLILHDNIYDCVVHRDNLALVEE